MPELSPEVWLIIILLSLGYYVVDAVKEPVKHAGKTICHVVTFGQKCATVKPLLPPLPGAEPPCPQGYTFLEGASLHGCFDARETKP